MKIYANVGEMIGVTPLLRLSNIEKKLSLGARLIAKIESANPAGSAKDRVAKYIIDGLESRGELSEGGAIIEPTSGNTGIGIAAIAASRGYRAIIVMPSGMSEERKMLIRAYGAELVETDNSLGMKGAIARAEELAAKIPGAVIAGQFTNPDNVRAHRETTGPEIWADTGGEVDVFVAGIGTGGTISGIGQYLKSVKSDVRIVGVEPSDSPFITRGIAGAHGIQGIGAGFIPEILDLDVIDEVVTMELPAAYDAARMLAACEGVLAGISSGAALAAAINEAGREENRGRTIVVLLPDTGERYLSAGLFE